MSKSGEATREVFDAVEIVLRGLDGQQELLEILKQLAESQGPLIEAGEHDSLLELVRRRQGLVDKLEQTRAGMTNELEVVRKNAGSLDADVREGIRNRVSRVQELVNKIAEMDMEDAQRLSKSQAACRDQLEHMTSATTARKSYQQSTTTDSRFADARG